MNESVSGAHTGKMILLAKLQRSKIGSLSLGVPLEVIEPGMKIVQGPCS